ncbi:hydantoin utilization protein-like protein A [Xylariomycetidae sp. FL2044]|nr:hydantoin utilization protein-like protein A [Xylariomycetidae sp. FL2044]
MASGDYRLGVDVGGTFTDVCVITPGGETIRAKTPSTPQDQSIGVKDGIDKVRKLLKAKYDWEGEFSFIHHGSTVATNAILESKGVQSGLIVTAGFKEVLANKRSQIPGGLGGWISYIPPEPVVPLERTVQCPGRISPDGSVVIPLDEAALRGNLADLKRQGPEAITISLLNSYVNDEHERAVARIVREEFGPGVEIICSADVLPEAGEYERTVTSAANAVVKPIVKRYMEGLRKLLLPDSKTIRILKSDGALTSLELAGELPVNLLMSGPAGGVQGVVDVISKQTPHKNLVTLDMGGTSTDVALIVDGKAALRRETVVDKLTVRAPSVDVRTVGAGGGSIAQYVDLTASMRVGPESAGASPGPACYQKGGKMATVTDANLTLGYLPEKLLGGDFQLDVAAAVTAVKSVADQMNISAEETAEGIVNLVNETMYGALRQVSVEQGYDPRDFALVAFGGAGPLHANAVGKLLGAFPIIVPQAPGVLCAEGDATTKLSHSQSVSYIKGLSQVSLEDLASVLGGLESQCTDKMNEALAGSSEKKLHVDYEVDLRYKGQALDITVSFTPDELKRGKDELSKLLAERFSKTHELQFGFSLDALEFELVRLGVTATDASSPIEFAGMPSEEFGGKLVAPPDSALVSKKVITVERKKVEAKFWDRAKLTQAGLKIDGPAVITEMDSNTLILPGFYGEIDHIGNILIYPADESVIAKTKTYTPKTAKEEVSKSPLIPTLVGSALQAIRIEMDTLVLRCSMSPGIREQQDEFNVVTNAKGQMLVGQFGSFIGEFLEGWKETGGSINEGDIFITNDPYSTSGAISHLNDVIVLLPIYYKHQLVGWSANFGHLSDVGGKVPGSMSISSSSLYEDGIQIPIVKLYKGGDYNSDIMDILCRNSRMPDWYRSDVAALVSSCKTAAARVGELIDRFGLELYEASCNELLRRNQLAVSKLIETQFGDEEAVFTDFVDDDGAGIGPYAVKCKMTKVKGNKLRFDFDGTSAQSNTAVNFFLSPTMFKMFVGYYLLAVFDPHCVVNEGLYDFIEVAIPNGSILKPTRPAALSCRTHLLGRVMDIIQALMGQHNQAYRAAAGFSDSPHFFYSGWRPDGTWFQLYQIAFGGVPARPVGDGPDMHCLFPAIKSVPAEMGELAFPLLIEANESLADTGGAGFYRGGNAQRTRFRFLSRGELSIHDDRWFTHPWGIDGGQPGQRSKKILYRYSKTKQQQEEGDDAGSSPPPEYLPSKCDHVKVDPGDVLEYITWGGGGLGDPLMRPAAKVALEVHRRLVTVEGAAANYGVVVDPATFEVRRAETEALRARLRAQHVAYPSIYNRGGTLDELRARSVRDTGLPAPVPQWVEEPYGAHARLPYVADWYEERRAEGDWKLE